MRSDCSVVARKALHGGSHGGWPLRRLTVVAVALPALLLVHAAQAQSLIKTGPRTPASIDSRTPATVGPRSPVGPSGPHRDPGSRRPPRFGGAGVYFGVPAYGVPVFVAPPAGPRIISHQSGGPRSGPPARRARSGVPPPNERRYVADEVVIEIAGNPSERQVAALANRFRLTRLESQRIALTNSTWFRWRIPDQRSVPAVVRGLAGVRAVSWAQPNYLFLMAQSATAQAGDPAQYALAKLRLSEAHGLARGDRVVVAVIDSGIDTKHPELDGVIAGEFDALGSNEGPHAHGTGIAGIIAAHSRLLGAAPAVRVLAVRAFGTTQGSTFSIIKSIDYASAQSARIINMSFAGPSDPALARALAAARQKGALLIAAAGNAGAKSPPLFPAADPNVIAVTATDADDHLFAMANRGNHVAIAAPGVDILVPVPGESYQMSSGTSFAAAYVSGVAALVLERKPALGPDAVKKVLLSTAKDLGPRGRDDQFGAGLADALEAIMSLEKPADGALKGAAR